MTARGRALGGFLAGVVVAGMALGGCGSGDRPPDSHPASTRSAPDGASGPGSAGTSPSLADLRARLLRLGDLPSGFIPRPLTRRNLPSDLTGCAPLEKVMAGGIGRHEQVEFFRLPFGPWIDEAVIQPAHAGAAETTARLAAAIDDCSSVTVTEEGERVELALSKAAPITSPTSVRKVTGRGMHTYRGTGELRGVGLSLQIVLARAGHLVLLITNTGLGRTPDPELGAKVVRAALARATQS